MAAVEEMEMCWGMLMVLLVVCKLWGLVVCFAGECSRAVGLPLQRQV
jgi:hypothetical protein